MHCITDYRTNARRLRPASICIRLSGLFPINHAPAVTHARTCTQTRRINRAVRPGRYDSQGSIAELSGTISTDMDPRSCFLVLVMLLASPHHLTLTRVEADCLEEAEEALGEAEAELAVRGWPEWIGILFANISCHNLDQERIQI